VIAQDQASSEHWDMPGSAVKSGAVDYVLPLVDIGPVLDAVVHGRAVVNDAASGAAN
jgi:chemotaxis response regulator CheB